MFRAQHCNGSCASRQDVVLRCNWAQKHMKSVCVSNWFFTKRPSEIIYGRWQEQACETHRVGFLLSLIVLLSLPELFLRILSFHALTYNLSIQPAEEPVQWGTGTQGGRLIKSDRFVTDLCPSLRLTLSFLYFLSLCRTWSTICSNYPTLCVFESAEAKWTSVEMSIRLLNATGTGEICIALVMSRTLRLVFERYNCAISTTMKLISETCTVDSSTTVAMWAHEFMRALRQRLYESSLTSNIVHIHGGCHGKVFDSNWVCNIRWKCKNEHH